MGTIDGKLDMVLRNQARQEQIINDQARKLDEVQAAISHITTCLHIWH